MSLKIHCWNQVCRGSPKGKRRSIVILTAHVALVDLDIVLTLSSSTLDHFLSDEHWIDVAQDSVQRADAVSRVYLPAPATLIHSIKRRI